VEIPAGKGITLEAAIALGIPTDDPRVVIDSEAVEMPDTDEFQETAQVADDDSGISGPFPTLTIGQVDGWLDGDGVPAGGISTGDDIPDVGNAGSGVADEEPVLPRSGSSSRSRLTRNTAKKDDSGSGARDAKSGPPSLDEWANFFGKIVLRVACNWYIQYAFRGIDEDMLTDREVERLAMTDEERKLISTPLAELSNKSKFMRKHGRTIVASGDAFNAMVVLGAWMSRVNRIAAKYKPRDPRKPTVRVNMNGSTNDVGSRSGETEATREGYPEGTHGGRIPNGYAVYNTGSG
jgi:hypothetical protein